MAGITLVQAEEQLTGALDLLKTIRTSQEYSKADLSLKRVLLKDASADVDKWDSKVKSLSAGDGSGKMQVRRVVPYV